MDVTEPGEDSESLRSLAPKSAYINKSTTNEASDQVAPNFKDWLTLQLHANDESYLRVYELFGIAKCDRVPLITEERAKQALQSIQECENAWEIMNQTKECMAALHAYHDLEVRGFFIYGTLRPDDNTSASNPWKFPLLTGTTVHKAILCDANLYSDPEGIVPHLQFLSTSETEATCSVGACQRLSVGGLAGMGPALVVGHYVHCDTEEQCFQKLTLCDQLLGYPQYCRRVIKEVQLNIDGKRTLKQAWVHQYPFDENAEYCRIQGGDWVARPSKPHA
uniref:Uncharacterized protein n=1 Tax=Eutreptiella gymnastica TaxID=73025 RepID=A0A7S4C8K7_9EUGL